MGSGKTHWGKILSRHTGLPYFDLDEVIVAAENKSVQQIFHDKGEEYFRVKEQEVLEALAEDHTDVIISTGGGTPCFFNSCSHCSGGTSEYVISRFSAAENSRATPCMSCESGPVSS